MPDFNELDICIIVFFALIVYFSCKTDFFASVFKLCSAAVSLLIIKLIYPYFNSFFITGLSERLYLALSKNAFYEKALNEVIFGSGAPFNLFSRFVGGSSVRALISDMAPYDADTLKRAAALKITEFLLGAFFSAALFFILSFVFGGLRKIVKTLSRFFIIRVFDKAAAVIFGLITGVIVLQLCFASVFLLFPAYYPPLSGLAAASFFMTGVFK